MAEYTEDEVRDAIDWVERQIDWQSAAVPKNAKYPSKELARYRIAEKALREYLILVGN